MTYRFWSPVRRSKAPVITEKKRRGVPGVCPRCARDDGWLVIAVEILTPPGY